LESNPLIGKTASLSLILKEMSKALNDSDNSSRNQIPPTREGVFQYLELYAMNADASDLERFVTFDYTKTLLTIQYKAANLKEVNGLLKQINEILKNEPNTFIIGGSSLIDKELSESVKTGQIYSMIFAFVAIFLLLALIFKSIPAGLLGSIPLLFSVCCTFGIMGWTGIELNLVTALLSSISIGLGVDFTIHIFWRMKSELMSGKDWKNAVLKSISGIGRGISINAFSVILGFSVLYLSAFPLIQSFALLIIISLLFCLLSALFLIPALCILIKPEFLISKNFRRIEIKNSKLS
jgi:predicted RND superfamily exporter protein